MLPTVEGRPRTIPVKSGNTNRVQLEEYIYKSDMFKATFQESGHI